MTSTETIRALMAALEDIEKQEGDLALLNEMGYDVALIDLANEKHIAVGVTGG